MIETFRASLTIWINTARKAIPKDAPRAGLMALADALEGHANALRREAHAVKATPKAGE